LTHPYYILKPFENKILNIWDDLLPYGLSSPVHFKTNSWGIRAREFARDDHERVLALGCSVTISEYIDQERTWTYLLEDTLKKTTGKKYWIGNAGKSKMMSRDYLTFMEHFIPQVNRYIHTIIMIAGINDLTRVLSKAEDYDSQFLEKAGEAYLVERAFDVIPGRTSWSARFKYTHLWQILKRIKHIVKPENYNNIGADYADLRKKRQMAEKVTAAPNIQAGLLEYENNLRRIILLARKNNLRLILATQPSLWNPYDARLEDLFWFGWINENYPRNYYSAQVLKECLRAFNQVLGDVCRDSVIELVDLAALLPSTPEIFYDDVHFNETGSQATAAIFAHYLTS